MKNKNKIIILFGLMILVLIAGTIFLNYEKNAENKFTEDNLTKVSLTKVSTRLSWFVNSLHAGFFVADKLGFYEKAGLKVTNNPGGPDFPAINLVISGTDDFGLISGIDPLLIARS